MKKIHQMLAYNLGMRDMERKADIFSIGGAKLLEMNTSYAVREHSGASKESLESDFRMPLTPMKDYAQAVEKYSGASLDAFKNIFNQTMVPMQEAVNVPSLQNPLVKAIERGFDNPLIVNGQNEAKVLDNAKVAKLEPLKINKDRVRSA